MNHVSWSERSLRVRTARRKTSSWTPGTPRRPGSAGARIGLAVTILALAGISVLAAAPTASAACPTNVDIYACVLHANMVLTSITGTGTALALSDDSVSAPIDLTAGGYYGPFLYLGTFYDSVEVTSNGLLVLKSATLSKTSYTSTTLPSANDPDGIIAPFWTDLNPISGGTIHYIAPSAGQPWFTAQWTDLHYYGLGGLEVTFQAQINVDTGAIRFYYQDLEDASKSITAGIENDDGTVGFVHSAGLAMPVIGDGILQSGDALYVDVNADDDVQAADFRLTDFGSGDGDTIVTGSDRDVGMGADDLDLSLCYYDSNANAQYTQFEPLYIHAGTCGGVVLVSDYRLIGSSYGAADTFVSSGNPDVNLPLSTPSLFNPTVTTGALPFGPGDDLYYSPGLGGNTVQAGWIRLVPIGSYAARTVVQNFDTDFGQTTNLVTNTTRVIGVDGTWPGLYITPGPTAPGEPGQPYYTELSSLGLVEMGFAAPISHGSDGIDDYELFKGTRSNSLSSDQTITALFDDLTPRTFYTRNLTATPGQSYYLRVDASNNAGTTSSPTGMVRAYDGQTRVFYEDFEGRSPVGTTSGLWRIDTLCAPPINGVAYLSYNKASDCQFDEVGTTTGSYTFSVDLSDWGTGTLYWEDYHQGETSTTYDNGYVEVSADGGPWTQVAFDTFSIATPFWRGHSADLSAYGEKSLQIRFRFHSVDSVANAYHGWSIDAIEVRAQDTVPSQVQNLAASQILTTTMEVRWEDAPFWGGNDTSTFHVKRGAVGGGGPYTLIGDAMGLHLVDDTPFATGALYTYQVTPFNSIGDGSPAYINITTWAEPSVPQGVAATAGPDVGQIAVEWAPPADDGGTPVTGYRILAYDGKVLEVVANLPAANLSFVDTGLQDGIQIDYTVYAENAVGFSSGVAASATTFDVPPAPTGVVYVPGPGAGEITVNWTAPSNDGGTPVTGYAVREIQGESLVEVGAVNASTFAFTHSGLLDGTFHEYVLVAQNLVGDSPVVYGNATTFDLPSVPQDLVMSPGPTGTLLSANWNAPLSDGGTEITGYNVYRYNPGTGYYDLVAENGALDTNVTIDGGAYDTMVTVRVVATNLVGESTYAEATNTAWGLPTEPTTVGAEAGPEPRQITVSWGAPLDDGGTSVVAYNVYRTELGEAVLLAEVGGGTLSYLHTGLINGESVAYAVTAVTDAGEGLGANATAEAWDVPEAAMDLLVRGGPGAGEINLTWSPPFYDGGTNITEYEITRYDPDTASSTLIVLAGSARAYIDSGLPDGDTYAYWITAVNIVGAGPASSTYYATTFDVPGAVGSFSATPSTSTLEVALAWDQPSQSGGTSVTGYNLYRSTGGPFSLMTSVGSSPRSYVDDNVSYGSTYTYSVAAVNLVGEGALSQLTTTTYGLPSVPPVFALDTEGQRLYVNASWAAPLDDGGLSIQGYHVYRAPSGGNLSLLADVPATPTGFTDSAKWDETLTRQPYDFAVAAYNSMGEGPLTAIATIAPEDLPTAPTALVANAVPGQVELAWGAPVDDGGRLVSYVIERKPSGDPEYVFLGNASATAFNDTAVLDGTTYDYRVISLNAHGLGGWAALTLSADEMPSIPAAPAVSYATAVDSFHIGWAAPLSDGGDPITAYRVYRSDAGSSPALVHEGNDFNITDTGLAPGTTYVYQVAAVNGVGEGLWSNATSLTSYDFPGAPVLISVEGGARSFTLDWNESVDGGIPIDTYVVYGRQASDPFQFITNASYVAGPVTFTTDGGGLFGNDELWELRVTAMNPVGESEPSNMELGLTHDLPDAPVVDAALPGPGAGQVTVTWQAPSFDGRTPITNYRVHWDTGFYDDDTGPFDNGTDLVNGSTLGHTILHDFGNDQTVKVWLSAVNAAGASATTVPQFATTHDVPTAPTGFDTVNAEHQIQTNWSPPIDDGGLPVLAYNLYGGDDAENLTTLMNGSADTFLSYIDAGLVDAQVRYYKVAAVNAAGEGAPTDVLSGRAVSAPDSPESFRACSGPQRGQITLAWQAPFDGDRLINEFRIYRGQSPSQMAAYAEIDQSTTIPTTACRHALGASAQWQEGEILEFIDSGNENGTRYHYVITAINSEGESLPTDPVFGTTFVSDDPPGELPEGRALTSAVFDGSAGYIFGGYSGNSTNRVALDTIVIFNPATQQNEVLVNDTTGEPVRLPSPRFGTTSVWVDDTNVTDGDATPQAFIFFGSNNTTDIGEGPSASSCHGSCGTGEEILGFDPTRLKIIPTPIGTPDGLDPGPRWGSTASYVPPVYNESGLRTGSHRVYVFGGAHDHGDHNHGVNASSCHGSCSTGEQVLGFDPAEKVTEVLPVTIDARFGAASAWVPIHYDEFGDQINGTGLIYLFGGHPTDEVSSSSCHGSCGTGEEILGFDPFRSKIVPTPTALPEPMWFTSAVPDGTKIYLFGGENHEERFNHILMFDVTTGTIIQVGDMPSARSGTSAIHDGESVYVFGGSLDGGDTSSETYQYRPGAPQGATAAPGGPRELVVTWQPPANALVAGITGYKVYPITASGAYLDPVLVPATSTSYTHTGLANNQEWSYRVTAINSFDEGPQSELVTNQTHALPGAPQGVSGSQDPASGDVTVTWVAPEDNGGMALDHYLVQIAEGSTSIRLRTAMVAPTQTTYTDPACELTDTPCKYRIFAHTPVGYSAPSQQITVVLTTLPGTI